MAARTLQHRLSRRLWRRGLPHEAYLAAGALLQYSGSSFKYFLEVDHIDGIEAIRRNHALLSDAAERAGVEVFAVSAVGEDAPVLGVPSSQVASLIAGLRDIASELPFVVALRGTDGHDVSGLAYTLLQEDVGEVTRVLVYLNFRERATDRRLRAEYGCIVEVWEEDEEGRLRAPSLNGRTATVGPRDRERRASIDLHGTEVPTFDIFARPGLLDVPFPIDVVYLWVDGSDPAWKERKAARLRQLGREPEQDALKNARFEEGDELRYSLRSLHRYAPWIRKIYLVTDRQHPAWLRECPGRLEIVDHTDILPPDCLPTFNSHAITGAVHHIEGLSERFLVMNDDILLGRPVTPDQFFFSNGATKFFVSKAALPAPDDSEREGALMAARARSAELVSAVTGTRPNCGFKHTPIAFDREFLYELENEFSSWRETLASPFRSGDNIVPEWIHHYIGYHRGRCFPSKMSYAYFDIGSPEAMKRLRSRIRKGRPSVLCVNDVTEGTVGGLSRHAALDRALAKMLPWQSPYESDQG